MSKPSPVIYLPDQEEQMNLARQLYELGVTIEGVGQNFESRWTSYNSWDMRTNDRPFIYLLKRSNNYFSVLKPMASHVLPRIDKHLSIYMNSPRHFVEYAKYFIKS